MNDVLSRVAGYGATAAVIGGLFWAGFVYRTDPDLMTMVSSVDVQLRMAAAMPTKDAQGLPLKERQDLLDAAADYLDRIDRVQPGFPQACEYRAFLAYLHRDFSSAAELYSKVRGLEGVTPAERDHAVLNEARMLKLDGKGEAAVALIRKHRDTFLPENASLVKRELGEEMAEPVEAIGTAAPATPATSGR